MLLLLVKIPFSPETMIDQFDCTLITVWKCHIWQQCYRSFTNYNRILYVHKIEYACALQDKGICCVVVLVTP